MATQASRRKAASGASIRVRIGTGRIPKHTTLTDIYEGVYGQIATQQMSAIIERFNELVGNIKRATPDALAYALLPTFELSQYYVPYKTGALQESGKLKPDYQSLQPRASITYGGGRVNYAAIVHEQTEFYHMPPTRSKYLQAALEETLRGMKSRVIQALQEELK